MRAVVVYESMFGNTRAIAEAVGAGLAARFDVTVVAVGAAPAARLEGADLIVVGGPTHTWGLSRPSTRASAAAHSAKPENQLTLEAGAETRGLREWFDQVPAHSAVAVFDTRLNRSHWLTGRASIKIARALRTRDCTVIAAPQSFLVDQRTVLVAGELERARSWGAHLVPAGSSVPAARIGRSS
jgi:hypothetical protein